MGPLAALYDKEKAVSPLQRYFAAMGVVISSLLGPSILWNYVPTVLDPALILIGFVGTIGGWIYLLSVKCPICGNSVHDRGSISRPDFLRGRACPKCGHDLNQRPQSGTS